MNLTPDQTAWIDRARDAEILDVAQRPPIAAKLKRHSREWVGPCPRCGGEDRFAVNPKKRIFICRGAEGGDVIAMVRHVCAVEFLIACELINGEPMPASDRQVSAEEIAAATAKREAERQARDQQREQDDNKYRESERKTAYEIWHNAADIKGTPAEAYLRGRGIDELPDRVPLRYAPTVAYFHGEEIDEVTGQKSPRVIYRGPAMVAAIVDAAGKFRAVHITWIDVDVPGSKVKLVDPDTQESLPAKKVRGSKTCNVIRLVPSLTATAARWIVGEGIETVLSVWHAFGRAGDERAAWRRETAFYSAVDLGNIGGRSLDSVPHPALKDKAGRVKRVAGPLPDLKSPGIVIPDSVDDVVLLGDGDSDRFTTQCVLARATKRFTLNSEAMTKLGRQVRTAWAPDGMDFNDLLRAA